MRASRLLAVLFVFLVAVTIAVADYPRLVPYVNDFAGVLTPSQESTLNSMARQIEQSTTVQIAIVTVESTGGEDRVLYANHLGDASGVGKAATDNGLVLLWSMANEKGGAIAVGSGIESVLNDAKVGRIGRTSRPYFDRQDYYNGFLSMLGTINAELGGSSDALQTAGSPATTSYPSEEEEEEEGEGFAKTVFWILVLVIIILVLIRLNKYGPTYSSGFRAGSFVGRSHGGFSSFGSFGRGGFGGGGFSGGGARF